MAEEPEAVRIAQALALAASLREGTLAACTPSRSPTSRRGSADAARAAAAPVVLRCRLGGWLHDVGKVAIPDEILLASAARSTTSSSRVMRAHPEIGERDRPARRRPEGGGAAPSATTTSGGTARGYPDGLAGESIPIEARIVAAADAYSAMTSDRAYRRALRARRGDRRAGAPGREPPRSARRAGAGAGADRGSHPPRLAVRPQRRRRRAPRRPAPRRGRVGRTYGGAQSPAWSSGSVAQMATACASVPSRSLPPTV